MQFKTFNDRLILSNMVPGTAGAKLNNWRSRIKGAWLIKINDKDITSIADIHDALEAAACNKDKSCLLLFLHPEIQHGLLHDGIPQINADQLNPRAKFNDVPMSSVPKAFKPQVQAL